MSNNSLTSSTTAVPDDSAEPVTDGQVAAVREFNRFYTNVIGLLREGLLDTPYSLAEARVLFELAREEEAETTHLRRWLDIDAGYLSRLLARFEADGLVTRTRSPLDGRRQVIGLTGAGRAVQADLDARSGAPRSAPCWPASPRTAGAA
jgi:DNA-binding MarR family transcriptional regulator